MPRYSVEASIGLLPPKKAQTAFLSNMSMMDILLFQLRLDPAQRHLKLR
jgi:hypothetical protein